MFFLASDQHWLINRPQISVLEVKKADQCIRLVALGSLSTHYLRPVQHLWLQCKRHAKICWSSSSFKCIQLE